MIVDLQTLLIFGFPIFRFWAYLMKVIQETRVRKANLSILSVPDEGYSRTRVRTKKKTLKISKG